MMAAAKRSARRGSVAVGAWKALGARRALGAVSLLLAAMTILSPLAAAEAPQMPISRDKPPPKQKVWPSCEATRSPQEVRVAVRGVRNAAGRIRTQLYDGNSDHFLAKGWKLHRAEAPAKEGAVELCVPIPTPGTYAIVVMHDENGNGDFDFLTEGFGFSRNPSVFLSAPSHDEVAFAVKPGVTHIDVDIKYLFSLRTGRARRGGRY